MTSDRIPDSEIDWNKVMVQYILMEQEDKRNKTVQIVTVAFRLFFTLGAILLVWMIIDFINGLMNGTMEPPTHSELAILVFFISDMVVMLSVLMLIRRL